MYCPGRPHVRLLDPPYADSALKATRVVRNGQCLPVLSGRGVGWNEFELGGAVELVSRQEQSGKGVCFEDVGELGDPAAYCSTLSCPWRPRRCSWHVFFAVVTHTHTDSHSLILWSLNPCHGHNVALLAFESRLSPHRPQVKSRCSWHSPCLSGRQSPNASLILAGK